MVVTLQIKRFVSFLISHKDMFSGSIATCEIRFVVFVCNLTSCLAFSTIIIYTVCYFNQSEMKKGIKVTSFHDNSFTKM